MHEGRVKGLQRRRERRWGSVLRERATKKEDRALFPFKSEHFLVPFLRHGLGLYFAIKMNSRGSKGRYCYPNSLNSAINIKFTDCARCPF